MVITLKVKFKHLLLWVKLDKIIFYEIEDYVEQIFTKLTTVGGGGGVGVLLPWVQCYMGAKLVYWTIIFTIILV